MIRADPAYQFTAKGSKAECSSMRQQVNNLGLIALCKQAPVTLEQTRDFADGMFECSYKVCICLKHDMGRELRTKMA